MKPPTCTFGIPEPKSMSMMKGISMNSILSSLFILFASCGETMQEELEREQMNMVVKMKEDAIQQYTIAVKRKNLNAMYTLSIVVASTSYEIKDTADYKKWKHIEDSLGKIKGVKSLFENNDSI